MHIQGILPATPALKKTPRESLPSPLAGEGKGDKKRHPHFILSIEGEDEVQSHDATATSDFF
jgi:hypothetical protein